MRRLYCPILRSAGTAKKSYASNCISVTDAESDVGEKKNS